MSPMGLGILGFNFLFYFLFSFQAQLAHPLETVTSFLSHDAFSVSSLRSWTIHFLNETLHLCAMNPSFMGSFCISPSDFLYISILLKIVYTITIEICDEFQPQFHCFRWFYLEAIKRNWWSLLRWADQMYWPIRCLFRRTDQTLSSSSMPSLFFGYLHLSIGSVSSEKHK